MALIPCLECGKKISDKATVCPNCGAPVNQKTQPPEQPQSQKSQRVPFTGQEMATLLSKKKTNHVLHLLLSIITGGLWIIVWLLIGISNARENAKIDAKIQGGTGQRKKLNPGLLVFFLLAVVFIASMFTWLFKYESQFSPVKRQTFTQPQTKPLTGSCKKHIELHSAATLAKEYGESEAWVVGNVKINLWEKPTSLGKGKTVGKLLPGSRAVILKISGEDYKVQSPFDGSVGWINKIQIKRTLFQDTKTRETCTPK